MLKKTKNTIFSMYMKNILSKERQFGNGECKLKYLFSENKKSNKLLVVFSGFPAKDKPPVYNYVLKFKNVNCNKLFILDDYGNDVRGSYYLGKENNFFVERAVVQLIDNICKDSNLTRKDVITTGTSKGGFASLYFGLKYNYGAVISGEPQVLLGDYLKIPLHLDIYRYIGGEPNEETTEYLNQLLLNLIDVTGKFPNMYLHCGKNGDHHKYHLKPFTDKLDEKEVEYTLDLGEYEDHNDVGRFFPVFAINSINKEIE